MYMVQLVSFELSFVCVCGFLLLSIHVMSRIYKNTQEGARERERDKERERKTLSVSCDEHRSKKKVSTKMNELEHYSFLPFFFSFFVHSFDRSLEWMKIVISQDFFSFID